MTIGRADPYTQLYLLRKHSVLSATYPNEWSEPISIKKKKSKYSKSENSLPSLTTFLMATQS